MRHSYRYPKSWFTIPVGSMTEEKLVKRAKSLFKLLCRKNTDPHTLQLRVKLITCFAALWVETENELGLDPTRYKISYKALARGCVWVLDVMAAGRHKYYEEPLWHLNDFLVVPEVAIYEGGYRLVVYKWDGPRSYGLWKGYPVCFWSPSQKASDIKYIDVQINSILDSIYPSSLTQPMDKKYPSKVRGCSLSDLEKCPPPPVIQYRESYSSNNIVITLPVLQYARQCIRFQQQELTARRFLTDKLGCEGVVDMIIGMCCFSRYQGGLSLTIRKDLYNNGDPYYKALNVPTHEAVVLERLIGGADGSVLDLGEIADFVAEVEAMHEAVVLELITHVQPAL